MSTLQSINLKHPSSASNNITLDSSGNATVANNVTVTGTGSVGGNLSFNSGYGSSVVAYGCRAWVNFNGTGTPAIRTSGNVSSITDNGTGNYTINFSTAMPDINYAAVGSASSGGDGFLIVCSFNSRSGSIVAPTTSAFRVYTRLSGTNSDNDPEYVYVAVHR